MELKNIIYLENYIKIFCIRSEETELISLDLIQNIRICYSIGLIDNPVSKIKGTIKINKKDIEFISKYIVIRMDLEDLHDPHKCEFTIYSLTFHLKDTRQPDNRSS